MALVGIDPGLRFAGFAVMKEEGTTVKLLDCGFLKLSPTLDLPKRVALFHDFFAEKASSLQLTDLALETPFLGKSAQNFLKLGYLRGILYLIAQKQGMNIYEFSPREVKQMVTGFGGAEKEQVARVILKLFPRLTTPEKYDVTDALAVTLCGLWAKKRRLVHR